MFKKVFIIILFFIITITGVYAISTNQKAIILENYKQKQYKLLFESNLNKFTDEFSDIFNLSKKSDIFKNISNNLSYKREQIEKKNYDVLEKIVSLEESIKKLDEDIDKTGKRVKEINANVIKVKNEIKLTEKTIEILRNKIDENREVLLKYFVYIYKKSNNTNGKTSFDNLKSILLNGDNISNVLDDLYFKGIIEVTGKKLINKHRNYISTLYIKKVSLKKQEENLKKLRKLGVVEKKILSDKKEFKERLLKISKGKQTFYQKYIFDKLKAEKKMILKSFLEQNKLKSLTKQILDKYNCKFVDLSKETDEVKFLSGRCLDLNKMIYNESKIGKKNIDVKFSWPVNPINGISAYFHEDSYKKQFGVQHEAIDIPVKQGTSIKAPADGYVIYIKKPDSEDYAFVALKHSNGFITVYGHINKVLVKEFQYIKSGEVFAKTGGEFGTFGAGFMTTGPHLHFEIIKDKKYIDPLNFLDLSYLNYSNLIEKYRFKYYIDFKKRKGYEFKDKTTTSGVFRLVGNTEIERQKYLLKKYAVGDFKDWNIWVEESLDGNIDPTFVMCIGLAETGLGKYLKTPYNIGNVGNTDSGATKTFNDARTGLYWMIHTLNNKYLSQYNEIRLLSRYGNYDKNKPIYASSDTNWHTNIIKCMSHIKGYYVPDNYNFRLRK